MKQQAVLTNFNVPTSTRSKFDQLCQMTRRTRTSVLIELMEDYVLTNGPTLLGKFNALNILASAPLNLTPTVNLERP